MLCQAVLSHHDVHQCVHAGDVCSTACGVPISHDAGALTCTYRKYDLDQHEVGPAVLSHGCEYSVLDSMTASDFKIDVLTCALTQNTMADKMQ